MFLKGFTSLRAIQVSVTHTRTFRLLDHDHGIKSIIHQYREMLSS